MIAIKERNFCNKNQGMMLSAMNAVTIWAIEQSITGGVKTGEASNEKVIKDLCVNSGNQESQEPLLLAGGKHPADKGTIYRHIDEGDPMKKVLPRNYKPDGINNLPGQKIPASPSTPKWKLLLDAIFNMIKGVTRPSMIIVPIPTEQYLNPNYYYDESGNIVA